MNTKNERMSTEVDWVKLFASIGGGVGLLLFGIQQCSFGLQSIAGDSLRTVLRTMSSTKFTGFLFGALAGALLQSSTAVTVLLVNFVSDGVMSFADSLPLLYGCQLGATLVSQLTSFKLDVYALYMICVGVFGRSMASARTRPAVHAACICLLGLGLLFHGNEMIAESVAPLRNYQPFLDSLSSLENPLTMTAIATVVTFVIQAASASISIGQALLTGGLISTRAGLAIVLGANVGTTGTSLLASLGSSRPAIRLAVAYVVIKLIGLVPFLLFLGYFEQLLVYLSPDNLARQLANGHTIFNLIVPLALLPFTEQLAESMLVLVPEPKNII